MHILFLFLDGIGLGSSDPEINPFAKVDMPNLQGLLGGKKLLLDSLPINGRPWGAARKVINLFLRDALYNKYLCRKFKIDKLELWLEIPLDSAVARGLKTQAGHGGLPQWPGLKNLKPDVSDTFQRSALEYAHTRDIERVHMDMYLWLQNR